jgi:outer membrane autotransporter protein
MNHIYSIVSSNPHMASRVAPETAKRRGTRGATVVRSAQGHAVSVIALGAFVLLGTSPALAQSCPGSGSITAPRTTTCTLGNNDNLTIESGGSVIVSGADAVFVPTATTVTIQNNGTLRSNQVGLRIAGNIQTLTNTGTVTSTGIYGIFKTAGTVGSIVNTGVMTGNRAIFNQGGVIGSISNASGGQIGGASTQYAILDGGGIGTISNEEGATIRGSSGAIYSLANGTPLTINNAGLIDGYIYSDTAATINIHGELSRITGNVDNRAGSVNLLNGSMFTTEGNFDTTTFSIASGGSLHIGNSGHSISTTTLNNAGTLHVPEGVVATVNGSYIQSGTLLIGASSSSSYGRLAVNGNATLTQAANFEVDVNGTNTLAAGQTLTNVLTATTLSNSASANSVTDNSYLFNFESVTNGNAVDLVIVSAASASGPGPAPVGIVSAVLQNSLRSGAPVAGVLDGLIRGGATGTDFDNVVTSLGRLPDSRSVALAVGQTMPSIHGNAPATLMHLGTSTGVVIQQQLQPVQVASLLEHNVVGRGGALASMLKRNVDGGGKADGASPTGQGLWVKTLGNRVNQDAVEGASGYHLATDGLLVGMQTELNSTTTLGIGLGYLDSDVDGQDFAASHSSDVESVQLVGYGRYALRDTGWQLNWQGDFTRSGVESERNITFIGRTAQAKYNGVAWHLGVGFSKAYTLNPQTTVQPMVALDWRRFKAEGYTETGAGALNLQVDEQTAHEAILKVGAQVQQQFTPKIQWLASAALGYDLRNQRNAVTARFTGGGVAFTTEGLPASRTLGELGAGIQYKASDNLDLVARYDLRVRRGLRDQTASVRLSWAF